MPHIPKGLKSSLFSCECIHLFTPPFNKVTYHRCMCRHWHVVSCVPGTTWTPEVKMVACIFLVVSNIVGVNALAQRYLNNSKSINPSLDILKDVLLVYFEKIKKKLPTGVLIMQLLSDLHIGRNIFKSLSQMAAWYKQKSFYFFLLGLLAAYFSYKAKTMAL